MSFTTACGNSKCSNVGNKRCSRCHIKLYCSSECQKKHWKDHKSKCIALPVDKNPKEVKSRTKQLTNVLKNPLLKLALLMFYLEEGRDFIFLISAEELIAYDQTKKDPNFRKLLLKDLKKDDDWHEFMSRPQHADGEYMFIEVVEDEKLGTISRRSIQISSPS
jgi:hypothetical protein